MGLIIRRTRCAACLKRMSECQCTHPQPHTVELKVLEPLELKPSTKTLEREVRLVT